ncbi:C2 domain-containing protein / GRAM domain-containing protein isoform 6 [Hibiscus syriacus]|uniref:C2 domain-containing protein / GRAM domain-containing protein isoform 6 n=1 Tax=Hibiscus syriacus TaxID=106335 RepID=A0A6A2XGM5_HIBSY|nr:C2 domain-containing protein / GRAM domain-containing protein isoform 6 [Hibiscus syriacus]
MGQWHAADEYEGQLREITFRSICNNPMCPPDSAMTEDQHFVLSSDKKKLVFETVQQAHDVQFGTYFEASAHFKKRCVMQSKIKSGAVEEYKKEIETMLDVARSNIESHIARELVLFDPSIQELRNLGIHAYQETMHITAYVESLVPLNGRSEHEECIIRRPAGGETN